MLRSRQLRSAAQDGERRAGVRPSYYVASQANLCDVSHRQAPQDDISTSGTPAGYRATGAHAWGHLRAHYHGNSKRESLFSSIVGWF
jgi:hypothetical protein